VIRITVARALQELVQEGFLVSRQGVGTFVNASRHPTELTNVSELYRRTFGGGTDGNEHLHGMIAVRSCNGDEGPGGSFGQDRRLWCVTRVRLVDGKAVSFEEAYLDQEYVPVDVAVTELETSLLHDFLTVRCGVRLRSTQVQIGAGGLTEEQAAVLQARADDPALLIRRVSTDLEGRVVAVSENVHPTNTYNYYFEFRHQVGMP
jgi:DNA-binding GntR family transcriptional regulator